MQYLHISTYKKNNLINISKLLQTNRLMCCRTPGLKKFHLEIKGINLTFIYFLKEYIIHNEYIKKSS